MDILLFWCLSISLLVSYFAGWHFIDMTKDTDTDHKISFGVISGLCFCGTLSTVIIGLMVLL